MSSLQKSSELIKITVNGLGDWVDAAGDSASGLKRSGKKANAWSLILLSMNSWWNGRFAVS